MSLLTSLAGHWGLHGNGNDSTANGRNFTITGTMTYTTGLLGQSATPNATNYFNIATPSWFDSAAAFSAQAWVYGTAFAVSEAAWSWGTANANQVNVLYPFQTSNGNGAAIYCNGGAFKYDLNTGVPALSGFHHVVLTVTNATTSSLYVDGVEVATSSGDLTNFGSLTNLRIGMYHNGGQGYSGRIEEFAIWLRALTPIEVSQLYNGGSGLPYASWSTGAKRGPVLPSRISPVGPSPAILEALGLV